MTDTSLSLFRKFLELKPNSLWQRFNDINSGRIIKIDPKGANIYIQQCIPGTVWTSYLGTLRLAFPNLERGDSTPFAWLYLIFGLHDSCHHYCCWSRIFSGSRLYSAYIKCPAPGCSYSSYTKALTYHWRSHCFADGLYRCFVPDCSHKCKRWADLERHASTAHCLDAKKFPCEYPGCKRGGDNGFVRKDKLRSHFKNVHEGIGIAPKHPRTLIPKN